MSTCTNLENCQTLFPLPKILLSKARSNAELLAKGTNWWKKTTLLRLLPYFLLNKTIRWTGKVGCMWILSALKTMNSSFREDHQPCQRAKNSKKIPRVTKSKKPFVTPPTCLSKEFLTRIQFWTSMSTNWPLCGRLNNPLVVLVSKIDRRNQTAFWKFTVKIRCVHAGLCWISSKVWSNQSKLFQRIIWATTVNSKVIFVRSGKETKICIWLHCDAKRAAFRLCPTKQSLSF